MAEVTLDLRGQPKAEAYQELEQHIHGVLNGLDPKTDEIAAMATVSCLVHHAFGHLWTGFYRVIRPNELLRVGPYQGTLGCLDITFGKGVCGTAASTAKTVIVEDVENFPGHITCDGRSKSEIVVPVFGPDRKLIAVFDVDSEQLAAFDETDRKGMESILAWFSGGRR